MITAKDKLEILSLPEDSPDSRDKAFEILYQYIYGIFESRHQDTPYTPNFQFVFLANQVLRILKVQNSQDLVEAFEKRIICSLRTIESSLRNFRNGLSVTDYIWENLRDVEQSLDQIYVKIAKDYSESYTFSKLFPFSLSQKDKINQLIQEAIEYVEADTVLTSQQKHEIIKHLEKALRKLDEKNTASVFGILKEAVIIIGAVGSTLGGAAIFLPQAHQKVQEAAQVVEEINYTFIQSGNNSSYLTLPSAELNSSPIQQLSPSPSNGSTQPIQTMNAELEGDRPTKEELKEIVESLLGCAKTDRPAPTDEEVDQMLFEALQEKYK